MQIIEVCLYLKNGKKRSIRFKENAVNIIQSNHSTGKSTLIDIIDYCLGQGKSHINSVEVRDRVDWFGLVVKINEKKFFIARQNLSREHNTDLMHFEQINGDSPADPPGRITFSRKNLINFLSEQIGITEVPLEYRNNDYFYASIRHALFFCYLNQNEISHTEHLYHRSHDGLLDLQIKSALEYFLGSYDEEIFYKFIDLQQLKQKLNGVSTKLRELEIIKGNVLEKAYEILGKCQRYDLVGTSVLPESVDEYILTLKEIVKNWKPRDIPMLNTEITSSYDELFKFREELKQKNELLSDLKQYSNITQEFLDEADHQKNRLKLIEIFEKSESGFPCPLCNRKLDNISNEIVQIKNDFEQIQNEMKGTRKVKRHVGSLIESLEEEKNKIKSNISRLSTKIQAFLDEQSDAKKIFEENMRISELMGEVKLWIESMEKSDLNSELGLEKKKIDGQILKLRKEIELNENSLQRINILNAIDKRLTEWAKELEIDDAQKYKILFEVDKIKLQYNQNRVLSYQELGGGHNMLALHVSLYLALHTQFLTTHRPVPRFIVFDQPSTPYFPEDPPSNNIEDFVNEKERRQLEKVFKFIIEKTELVKNLQVIITDQAKMNDEWFKERMVKDWGDGLIPYEWLTNNGQ